MSTVYRKKNAAGQEYGSYLHDFKYKGQKYRINTETTDRKKAIRAIPELKQGLIDRIENPTRHVTLGQVEEAYRDQILPKLGDSYNCAIRLDKLFGKLKGRPGDPAPKRWHLDPAMLVSDLKTKHIHELRAAREREGNADGTIDREVGTLQAVLAWGVEHFECPTDAKLKFPKVGDDVRPRALKPGEVKQLLDELDPLKERLGLAPLKERTPEMQRMLQDNYDLAVFLLKIGCRYGEACNVILRDALPTWDADNKLVACKINLRRAKKGRPKKRNKNNKQPAIKPASMITAPASLLPILERRLTEREPGQVYLFPGRDPATGRLNGMKRKAVCRAIMKALDRAGLNAPEIVEREGRANVHTLRHTYATDLLLKGASDKFVATMLGHSSTAMVNKHYGNIKEGDISDEMAQLVDRTREDA